MTQYPELFAALAAPFDEPGEIKIRKGPGGRDLEYATARTFMNRLDDVLGPENWWDQYIPLKNSVVCILSIRLPDGQILTKSDAGGHAGMQDEGDDDKSGYSDALKRTCVKFGIARYLYRDGIPGFVMSPEEAGRRGILLHQLGVPVQDPVETELHDYSPRDSSDHVAPAPSGRRPIPVGRLPTTGKGLWVWSQQLGTATGKDITAMVLGWAKNNGHSSRVVDWDIGLVTEANAWVASELDRMGLLDIPPEARQQMAGREECPSSPRKTGPLSIDPSDPLAPMKLKIKEIAKDLSGRLLPKGQILTEVQAMAWIDTLAVSHQLPQFKEIRNFSKKKPLEDLLRLLYAEAAEADLLS